MLLEYTKQAEQAVLEVMFKAKVVRYSFKSQKNVLNLSFTSNFTLNVTEQYFQHYQQSYCDYLWKKTLMGEEQAVFEKVALSHLEMWSSTGLQTFNN